MCQPLLGAHVARNTTQKGKFFRRTQILLLITDQSSVNYSATLPTNTLAWHSDEKVEHGSQCSHSGQQLSTGVTFSSSFFTSPFLRSLSGIAIKSL